MSIFTKIFEDKNPLKKYSKTLAKIASFEEPFSKFTDQDFPKKTEEFKNRLQNGETLDGILPEAFALVREASARKRNERHFDVQMVGGFVLHSGNIAEMRTGEGKTLVATLPVYLNALSKMGVHVVTVNDYLARRDATWMGEIYAYLGLSIGVINSQNVSYVYDKNHTESAEDKENASFKVEYQFLKPSSRKQSYACDITYGTNSEFGFDYLRDNLAVDLEIINQRGHNFAIVDEVDSILIDEARTPLIISNPSSESDEIYKTFSDIASKLDRETDFTVDEKQKAIQMTESGIEKAEKMLNISNIYTEKGIKYVHHLETAVKAKALYVRDKDYVLKDGEVIIVDPFTGRMQPGRRWSQGLHQAIEAKEGIKIEKESRSVATITYQNYFKLYKKLSGMTGTAETSKEEFQKVYGLDVVTIPTNKKVSRIDQNDLIFQTEKGKFKAIARKVGELQKKGQPVLIGTVSVEKSEFLSLFLQGENIEHTVLNAKNHEREGEIIASAGQVGSVVVATNMAGRGVDIKLGGKNATQEQSENVKNLGGLYVIGTERHEARRIDNQLRGRSGRQGDPGETQFYVSMEDDLMRIFGSDGLKKMMGRFGIPEDQPITTGMISRGLENAQRKIEGFHFDSRKHTLEYDNVLNHQRGVIYDRRNRVLRKDKDFILQYLASIEIADFKKIIDEKIASFGEDVFFENARRIILYLTDVSWIEHLETMDYTRSSVNLRAYGQHDPLVEYKKEGIRLFREMENNIKSQAYELIVSMEANKNENQISQQEIKPIVSDINFSNVGKNDLCPCGSGKKFKKCHGK